MDSGYRSIEALNRLITVGSSLRWSIDREISKKTTKTSPSTLIKSGRGHRPRPLFLSHENKRQSPKKNKQTKGKVAEWTASIDRRDAIDSTDAGNGGGVASTRRRRHSRTAWTATSRRRRRPTSSSTCSSTAAGRPRRPIRVLCFFLPY